MASKTIPYAPLRIVVDTREQRPYQFEKYDVEAIRHTLKTGDYSLAGYEDRVAFERKSLDDLIGCLTTGRDRFERELARAKGLDLFAVIVEGTMQEVREGRYRSRINPHAALQSIIAFQVRYGTQFVWAGSRANAEYATYWMLEKFKREQESAKGDTPPAENVRASGESQAPKRGRAPRAN
ncbi:ERCC4 domain-containing protein [Fundidesulfovibrio putealis]|uniref:ERCC4 domain-containing protein n=1 Tax=Fundidesulfovibrio putealis TaxID=270496 RepID=UPI000481024D|nr:ERCC4 domain-containing protein [Fundidesulfovibrio putealis]